jgi:hypothetical protein
MNGGQGEHRPEEPCDLPFEVALRPSAKRRHFIRTWVVQAGIVLIGALVLRSRSAFGIDSWSAAVVVTLLVAASGVLLWAVLWYLSRSAVPRLGGCSIGLMASVQEVSGFVTPPLDRSDSSAVLWQRPSVAALVWRDDNARNDNVGVAWPTVPGRPVEVRAILDPSVEVTILVTSRRITGVELRRSETAVILPVFGRPRAEVRQHALGRAAETG